MPAKMNPFEVKTKPADRYYMDWQKLYPRPYDKNEVDPYTRLRIILMNGTEYEANWFSHQFHRHCTNNDLRRELAVLRRTEQQQQKRIACSSCSFCHLWQYRIILSADTASEVRQMPSQKRR